MTILEESYKIIQHMRKHPPSYIGWITKLELIHLFQIAINIPLEQAANGNCQNITVIIENGARMTISDDSYGLPMNTLVHEDKLLMESLFTTFVTFDENPLKHSDQLLDTDYICDVGYVALNAFSKELLAENHHKGLVWRQCFSRGKTITSPTLLQTNYNDKSNGLTVCFTPDYDIFGDVEFDYDVLATRCKHLAFLIQGLRINLIDERAGQYQSDSFHSDKGVASLAEEMINRNANILPMVTGTVDMSLRRVSYDQDANPHEKIIRFRAEFAIQFTNSSNEKILSFCNTMYTLDFGTHVDGLRQGIQDFLKSHHKNEVNQKSQLGYVGIISIFHPCPYGKGNTIPIITDKQVFSETYKVVRSTLHKELDGSSSIIQQIMSTLD